MRIIWAWLFLSMASMAYGQQSADLPLRNKEHQKAKADDRGTEKAPLVVKALAIPKSKEEAAYEAEERQEKRGLERATLEVSQSTLEVNKSQLSANIWQTLFNGLLLLTTAIAAYITNKSANAAKVAADYAGKSAEIAERSLVELESAKIQVNVPSLQASLRWGIHAGPDVTYNMTNHGRTPARILDVRTKMLVIVGEQWPARGTGEDFKVHDTTRNLLPGGSTEGFYDSLGRELTGADQIGLTAVETKSHRIFFVGRIQYRDIFHRRHTRWFCYKRFPVEGEPGRFTWAERGPENYNEETVEPAKPQ